MRRLLVVGLGDVGGRVARAARDRGWEVLGVRRGEAAADVPLLRCEVSRLASELPAGYRCEAVLVALAPQSRSPEAYRATYVDGWRAVAALCPRLGGPRLLVCSSTAVYRREGPSDSPLTEDDAIGGTGWNGALLSEAETAIADTPKLCRLRIGGIYGPGRTALLQAALAADPARPRPPSAWSNRIFVDDLARVLTALLDTDPLPAVLNVVDDRPASRHQVEDWIRHLAGLPPLSAATPPAGGRPVSNARLRRLGLDLDFPDYRIGYAHLLASAG